MIHGTGRRPGARGLVVVTAMTMCGMTPMLGSATPAQADGPVLPHGGDTARAKPRVKARTSSARVRSGRWRPVRTNIALTTSSPQGPVLQGHTYSWSYTVTNTRTVARTVRFTAVMPQGVGFVSAGQNCSMQAGGQVVCELGTMQVGETRTGIVSGKIITQESGQVIDMNGAVSGSVVKQVRAGAPRVVRWGSLVTQRPFPRVLTAAAADVSVSQSAPARVSPGGTITYKLMLRNRGPATARNVVLTDTVLSRAAVTVAKGNVACTLNEAGPRGSAGQGGTGGTGGAPGVRAGFVCALGTLAPGQATKLTLGVQVGSGARPGTVVRAPAKVTTSTPETDTANNVAEARTRVVAPSAARLAAVAQRPARSGASSSSSAVPSKASTEQGSVPSVGMSQLPQTGEPTARLIAISLGMVVAGGGMLGAGAYRRRLGGGTGGGTATAATPADGGTPDGREA